MGVNEARLQPADPPHALTERKAWVQLGSEKKSPVNTIVIPHDLQDDNATPWACKENFPTSQPVPVQRSGNEVVFLIDGIEALPQFQCEMEKTSGPGDFIYLAGWFCDIDLKLPSGRTLREIWTEKAKAGVKIRIMLCAQFHEGNGGATEDGANIIATDFVNSLSPDLTRYWNSDAIGRAVSDARYAIAGSHHQKIIVVKAGDQLTAFCGGVDVNEDRMRPIVPGAPIHDVHCRVRGPAALDLLQIFHDRWNDYLATWILPKHRDGLTAAQTFLGLVALNAQQAGTFQVQVCRTFGHIYTEPYTFAPKGEQSIRKMIENAIQQAKRFIYIEDQYLIETDIAKLIAKQLPKLQHVTILIPPANFNAAMIPFRQTFLDELYKVAPDKVHVYYLSRGRDACGTYIHAKTWVFDDRFAVIGSANCNYRGYTHDSEVSAGIYDPSKDSKLSYTFAHRLRIKLWTHHLDMEDRQGWSELADGVASIGAWELGHGRQNLRVTKFENSCNELAGKIEHWLDPGAIDVRGDF